jgi:multiple sugar transport system permease protein
MIMDALQLLNTYWALILPLSKPALAALTIFVFMNQWNDFFWPLIAVSNVNMRTLQLGLAYFQQSNTAEWGPLMTISLFATLPILVVFTFAQKWFIEGITMTGLKG